ncbi:hypothetical protein Cpir12675_003472 [Ceratocystis pirilliformis]|uniref:Ras-related protein RABB1b n=1 Tax=Ceratocystis pirilliformis TaxID=259994 RepID=A0ABR3Z3J8_9PEZI
MASAPTWDYIAKLVCIGDSGCGKSSLTIRLCEGRFSAHHDVTIGVEFGSRIVPVGPPHSDTYAPPSLAQGSQDNTTSSSPLSSSATTPPPASTATGLPPPPRKPKTNSKDARDLPLPQKHMKLSLWDTAGQETYKSVTRSYFRGASGALLVFDLTRKQTFDHVTDWLADLRQIAEPDIVVVLVGNKADLTVEEGGNGNGKREVTRAEAEAWARANDILEYVETSAKSGENVESAFMHVAEQIHMNIQAGKYDLNDRRSGVKGHASATGQRLAITADKAVKRGCC